MELDCYTSSKVPHSRRFIVGPRDALYAEEDLAKSGYKQETKYKSTITFLYLWLHNESQAYESDGFILFSFIFPHSLLIAQLKTQFFIFHFFDEISPIKKALISPSCNTLVSPKAFFSKKTSLRRSTGENSQY
jgi:hypothetical protein